MYGTKSLNSKIYFQIYLVSLVTEKVQRKFLVRKVEVFCYFHRSPVFFKKVCEKYKAGNKPANE